MDINPHYVLPLNWSLCYALTKRQWRGLRERYKKLFSDWERCKSCPGRCKARTLDEEWEYDHASHTKIFTGAAFICNGCHWLKSPAARLKTWSMPPPPLSKPSHLIECLGWTQAMVDARREYDLGRERAHRVALARLAQGVRKGEFAIMHTPIDGPTTTEIEAQLRPGQRAVMPWRINLLQLSTYGYTSDEIRAFESRMYDVATERLQALHRFENASALGIPPNE
jgi:hypothetical protein